MDWFFSRFVMVFLQSLRTTVVSDCILSWLKLTASLVCLCSCKVLVGSFPSFISAMVEWKQTNKNKQTNQWSLGPHWRSSFPRVNLWNFIFSCILIHFENCTSILILFQIKSGGCMYKNWRHCSDMSRKCVSIDELGFKCQQTYLVWWKHCTASQYNIAKCRIF